jgi:hypothetical protein
VTLPGLWSTLSGHLSPDSWSEEKQRKLLSGFTAKLGRNRSHFAYIPFGRESYIVPSRSKEVKHSTLVVFLGRKEGLRELG